MDLIRRVLLVLCISVCGSWSAAAAPGHLGSDGQQAGPARASSSRGAPQSAIVAPPSATTMLTASATSPTTYYGGPYYWHDIYYGNGGPFGTISATADAYFAWYQHYWGVYSGCSISTSPTGSGSSTGTFALMYERGANCSGGPEYVVGTAYSYKPGKTIRSPVAAPAIPSTWVRATSIETMKTRHSEA